ncbi:MAG TPA: hypothetical protein PKZ28_13500, partial [Piscinibacter sp.]|nr:hypothetical protein [Piscinibacter sp.]
MSRKLTATAAASALLVLSLATSAADAWTLPSWLQRAETAPSASAPATHVAAAVPSAAAPVSVAALSAGQMPNYRAIVQSQGP